MVAIMKVNFNINVSLKWTSFSGIFVFEVDELLKQMQLKF